MAKPTARRRKKQKRGSGPSAGRRRRLSLCMIVRDEAELLPHCLRSVQGVVDEIIIVDTGSIDDTVAIAEAAGAKVLSHAWTGDFAAARNASLAEASGDFVLVLDADEQLTKGAGAAIRRAMRDGGFDCGFLPLHNASSREASHAAVVAGEAAASEVLYLPRLLRKVGDLRYRGIIHESVGQWLKQRGSKPRFVEGADIVHYGYVREVSADKKKRDRNVALLEQACREHPEEVSNHGYLALAFAEEGSFADARARAQEGLRHLGPPTEDSGLDALRLSIALALAQVAERRFDEALEALEVARLHWPQHPDAWFLRATTNLTMAFEAPDAVTRAARIEEALASFSLARRAREGLFVQRFFMGATTHGLWTQVGIAHLAREELSEARVAFEASLETCSGVLPAIGRGYCLAAQGKVAEGRAAIQPHLGPVPDAWVAAALVAEIAGDVEGMKTNLVEASRRAQDGFASPFFRQCFHDASAALGLLIGDHPRVPGPIGALAALLRGEAGVPPARPAPHAMTRRLLQRLVLQGHAERLAQLLSATAEATLPGIARALHEAVASLEQDMRASA